MRNTLLYLFVVGLLFNGYTKANAQIETRLATQCVLHSVEVPINFKNLENIRQFQLQLIFDNNLLRFDTSLYHQPIFAEDGESYKIKVKVSSDTIFVNWAAATANLDGVSQANGLMFSLVFEELGNGDASFQWIENNCFYKNKDDLVIDANYMVDGNITLPFETNVRMSFDQFQYSCRDNSESGGCKAQAEVNLEGGVRPYSYQWLDKLQQKDSIAIGLCQAPVASIVMDASGCTYASLFDAIIYPAAEYEIEANPELVYITTPVVDFSIVTDDSYIETYLWDFGDEATANTDDVTHLYEQVGNYNVSLKTENIDGCDTVVYLNNYEVKELNFCIPNVFTPNGDGINDTWIYKIIDGSSGGNEESKSFKETGISEVKQCSGEDLIFADHFKTSHLVILNRRGNVVYECNNCTDYWDGSGLPDGVYFYVFTWEGEYSNDKEQGNVTILGSGK